MLNRQRERRITHIIALAVFSVGTMAGAQASAATSNQDPTAFVRDLGNRAIALLSDRTATDARRMRAFASLFRAGFDIDFISRFVLGRHWRQTTNDQRIEYRSLYERYVLAVYWSRLGAYADETFAVGGAQWVKANAAVVTSRIIRRHNRPVHVAWRLRRGNGGWRIVDVVVEGISMAVVQRDEFGAVIRNSGGGIDGLLRKLRAKVAQAH